MNKEHTIHVRLTEGQYNDLVTMMYEKGLDINVSAIIRQIINKEVQTYFTEKNHY